MSTIDNINFGQGTIRSLTKEGTERAGQLDFDNFLHILDTYQSDAIDYLYDLEPRSQNLFWVGYFRQAVTHNGELRPFYNASYRINKISIPMPSMSLSIQNSLRAPIFDKVEFPMTVNISWHEDVYHSVHKYHLDWFARWYNRQYDVLRCGVNGKFRQLTIVAYHYINEDVESIIEVPSIQPIMAFKIGGLVPEKLPSMDFDHGSAQNDKTLDLTYKCGLIQWAYSDKIGLGQRAGRLFDPAIADNPSFVMDENNRVDIWNPEGFAQEGSQSPMENILETVRITRAATSHMVAEGALG